MVACASRPMDDARRIPLLVGEGRGDDDDDDGWGRCVRACDDDGAMCECGEGARVIRARVRRDGSEDDAWRDGARARGAIGQRRLG